MTTLLTALFSGSPGRERNMKVMSRQLKKRLTCHERVDKSVGDRGQMSAGDSTESLRRDELDADSFVEVARRRV